MAGTPDRTTLNVLALEAGCGWGGPNGLFFSESFADGIVATPGGGAGECLPACETEQQDHDRRVARRQREDAARDGRPGGHRHQIPARCLGAGATPCPLHVAERSRPLILLGFPFPQFRCRIAL